VCVLGVFGVIGGYFVNFTYKIIVQFSLVSAKIGIKKLNEKYSLNVLFGSIFGSKGHVSCPMVKTSF
jgi:hypothetical protein